MVGFKESLGNNENSDSGNAGAWDNMEPASFAEKVAVEADTESGEHEDVRARAKAIREHTKADARATYDMWMEQADRMEKHDPANADSIRRIANVFKHRVEERLGEKI